MKRAISSAISAQRLATGFLAGLLCVTMLAPASAPAADGCFPAPSACGFPDATNTGVPPGMTLTPSGSLTLASNGQVVEGVDLLGTVRITADGVTIRNSRLRTTASGETPVIELAQGAQDFTLEDSDVGGNGSTTNAPQSNIWNHYWESSGMRIIRSHLYGTPDNIEGRVDLLKDSFLEVDASRPGSHDENIFIWCTTVNVQHSTLVNYHPQTATVFGETNGCNGNHFTIENSLLAGGGYVLYPQSGNPHPIPDAQTTIAGNRFARCLGAPQYNPQSGGTACANGPDSNGIFPQGGYFGLTSAINGPTVWKENVWDDEAPRPQNAVREGPAIDPAGNVRGPRTLRPKARWTAPGKIHVHESVSFDATRSTGSQPLRCAWTIENRTGSIVYGRMRRCRSRHRFRWPGVRYIELEVKGAKRSSDSLRRRVRVFPG